MDIMFMVTFIGINGRTYMESRLCPDRVEDRQAFAKWCGQTGLERHKEYVCAQISGFNADDPELGTVSLATYNREYFARFPQTMPANY
jgi:hypothetical protein